MWSADEFGCNAYIGLAGSSSPSFIMVSFVACSPWAEAMSAASAPRPAEPLRIPVHSPERPHTELQRHKVETTRYLTGIGAN